MNSRLAVMTAGKCVHGADLAVTRTLGIVTLYRKFLFI